VLADFVDGAIVVAHNARVDWTLVRRDCPALTPLAVVDTLRLSRALWPDQRQHGLDRIAERVQVEVTVTPGTHRAGRHTALHDALVTARVFVRMLATAEERHLALAELLDGCALRTDRPTGSQLNLFLERRS
jgi:DNA polymerase III alpha subunit (gram-positive type)